MKYKINDPWIKQNLKIGDWVRTNGDTNETTNYFKGEVGRIKEDRFYVWQNEKDGTIGEVKPVGYRYSWMINFDNKYAKIEILKFNKPKVLSKELQTLYKAEYIDSYLKLTEKGKSELLELLAAERRKELAKLAEEEIKE